MPYWIKLFYSLFLCLLFPVYWRHYGPDNFLWFSDIALVLTAAALWMENRLLASIAAVSVLLLELTWNLDFFTRLITGVRIAGLADYMFESHRPLYLRALSLFHLPLPLLLLWMLRRLGYDPRALPIQTALAWIILPLTYWLTDPSTNINWVFGPRQQPQRWMPPPAYLALLMLIFPACVFLPTHLILKRLFAHPPA